MASRSKTQTAKTKHNSSADETALSADRQESPSSKRRRTILLSQLPTQEPDCISVNSIKDAYDSPSQSGRGTPAVLTAKQSYVFKNPNFIHSMKAEATSKRRIWKNLKQILTAERQLPWKTDDVTYANIEAPPSFYPAKKYSDISGLPAKYLDPQTKLRYASADEFAQIRTLPSDIIAGLLQLRKANSVVG